MSFLAFIVVTIGLAAMEWLLSLSIAVGLGTGNKGLTTDLIAAMMMVIAGTAFEMTGTTVRMQCLLPPEAFEVFPGIEADQKECQQYAEQIMSFGAMLKSTLGMNSVVAALVLYFAAKGAMWLINYHVAKRSTIRTNPSP